jgi:hypothetical protein
MICENKSGSRCKGEKMDQDRLLQLIGEGANTKARTETLEQLASHGLDPKYLAGRLKALCEARKTKSQWVSGTEGVFGKKGEALVAPEPAGWKHTVHEDNTTQLHAVQMLAELLDTKPAKVTRNLNVDIENKMAAMVMARVEQVGQLGMNDIEEEGEE